jgi:hypothetical protein
VTVVVGCCGEQAVVTPATVRSCPTVGRSGNRATTPLPGPGQ